MWNVSAKTQGLIEIHFAVLLFGFAGLFGKFLNLAPAWIVFGRTFFASLVLYLVLQYLKHPLHLKAKEAGHFFGLGALLALHWWTFFHSIQLSTVAIGLLTFSTFPIFITFLEPYFFNEKLRPFDVLTAGLVCVGLFLVIPDFEWSNSHTQGAFWGTLAGFTFAILSLMNRKYTQSHSPLVIAYYQNFFATLVFVPVVFFENWNLKAQDFVVLAVLGIFCTAGAHALFIRGLRHIKTQLASIIASLEPVYGVAFALVLLKEIPTGRTLLGGLIILGTMALASVAPRYLRTKPATTTSKQPPPQTQETQMKVLTGRHSIKQVGQPKGDLWNECGEQKHDNQRNQKRKSRFQALFKGHTGHFGKHEKHHAHRRGQQANHEIQNHKNPKVDGIDSNLFHDGHQNRHKDGDGRNGFHETANQQNQQRDDEHQNDFVFRKSKKYGRKMFGHLIGG